LNGASITDSSGNAANLSLTGLTQTGPQIDTIGTIALADQSGNTVRLYNTGDSWENVTGSNGTIYETSAQANISGGSDTIVFAAGSGNAASLYNTSGNWDQVNGSNGAVILNGGAQASIVGGGDTITFSGSGDWASLYSTSGNWDVVNGSNGEILLTGAQTSVAGSGDVMAFSGNDTVTSNGGGNLFEFSAALGLSTINGFDSSDTMQLSKSDFANFHGLQQHMSQSGANTLITLDASDQVTLTNVIASNLSTSEFKFV
jgi:hypothetical protein